MEPRRNDAGYIMLEAAVALVLMTMGVYAIHGTIQQAIEARGQAQDYTEVRFLLERILAEVEMQPELSEHDDQGTFEEPHQRFSWHYSVRRVNISLPPPPPESEHAFRYPQRYLAHVQATVTWTRAGKKYSESFDTLFTTQKLWQPPDTP